MPFRALLHSFLEIRANKNLTGSLGVVAAAAISLAASPDWGLALLIFGLILAVASLFMLLDKRFQEVKVMHSECEEARRRDEMRLKKIISAMFRNGHTGKKKRKVDEVLQEILGEDV